ncbi:MAG: class I SAM-dependent methyltransferase [Pseudonocardiales bacterium]|nr:class I SAM-dependent methyltransferase [Pseudonocardiales bacterium]
MDRVVTVEVLALVESIPGWLRSQDADKLYELAKSTPGPILEIGTYRGKSAVLMALAVRDAQHDTLVYTVDVDRNAIEAAATEARTRGVADVIVFVRGTVAAFAHAYPHLRPALTFVDGDHSRAGVDRDLAVLEKLVPAGGLLVFHDFADPRNDDPTCQEVKVRPAVEASWVVRQCVFEGAFGVCGLFARREAPSPARAAVADISALDGVRDQYLYRLRHPMGKLWRTIRGKRS